MSEHNVLYIVEGSSENKMLGKMWGRFGLVKNYEVFIFKTNIHVLTEELFHDGKLDTDLDIVRVLGSKYKDSFPHEKFAYVYMIFDLDPQDENIDLGKIREMLDFFNDPGGNGRLFLNYPMLESYRHMKSLDDEDYISRKVGLDALKGIGYKMIVEDESCSELKQLNSYTKETFTKIIVLSLRKMNYMLTGNTGMITEDEYFSLNGSEIFDRQVESMRNDGSVFVLCTCVFAVVEYKPSLFFE